MNIPFSRTAATALLLLGATVACTSPSSHETTRRHKGLLLDATRALKSDRDARAIEFARQVEVESVRPDFRLDAGVLIAEAHLRAGDYGEAERRLKQLRRDLGPDPVLDELDGKLSFKRFDYDTAIMRFMSAEQAYDEPQDRSRARDLLNLARGCSVYADGAITDAERHWNKIEDLALRDDLNRVLHDVATSEIRGSL